MTKEEYAEYLKTPHWKDLRARKIAACGPRCQDCGNTRTIQVHHLRYRNIFDVLLDDLKVVCRVCHEKIHGLVQPKKSTGPPKTQKQKRVVRLFLMLGNYAEPDPAAAEFEFNGHWFCVNPPLEYGYLDGLSLGQAKSKLNQMGVAHKTWQHKANPGETVRPNLPRRKHRRSPKGFRGSGRKLGGYQKYMSHLGQNGREGFRKILTAMSR